MALVNAEGNGQYETTSTVKIGNRNHLISASSLGDQSAGKIGISVNLVPLESEELYKSLDLGRKCEFTYDKQVGIGGDLGVVEENVSSFQSLEPLISSITTRENHNASQPKSKFMLTPDQVIGLMRSSGAFAELANQKSNIISAARSGNSGGLCRVIAEIPAFGALFNGSSLPAKGTRSAGMVGYDAYEALELFNARFNDYAPADSPVIKKYSEFCNFDADVFMRMLLVFRDIGKSLGDEVTDRKTFTIPILHEAMSALGFREEEVNLAKNLLLGNSVLEDLGNLEYYSTAYARGVEEQLISYASAAGIPVPNFLFLQHLICSCKEGSEVNDTATMSDSARRRMLFLEMVGELYEKHVVFHEAADCSLSQRKFVIEHMDQMILAGFNRKWTYMVGYGMAKLYQEGIEKVLLSPNGDAYGVQDSSEFFEKEGWREWCQKVETHLKGFMAAHGGSLALIHDYQRNQDHGELSCLALAVKSLLFEGKREVGDENGYFTSLSLPDQDHNFSELAERYGSDYYTVLRDSIVMYRAFTAIGLHSVEHPLIDKNCGTCSVTTNVNQWESSSSFQNVKVGDVLGGTLDDVAVPTSLSTQSPAFLEHPKFGKVGVQIDVPFSRIIGAFFLSTQPLGTEDGCPFKMIADISDLWMTVIDVSDSPVVRPSSSFPLSPEEEELLASPRPPLPYSPSLSSLSSENEHLHLPLPSNLSVIRPEARVPLSPELLSVSPSPSDDGELYLHLPSPSNLSVSPSLSNLSVSPSLSSLSPELLTSSPSPSPSPSLSSLSSEDELYLNLPPSPSPSPSLSSPSLFELSYLPLPSRSHSAGF
jgi:hypothetical protein